MATETENQIVVYQPNETVRSETRYAKESIWLTQLKIAELFGVQKAAISKHLKNIYDTGELVRSATVSKMETVQTEGKRTVTRVQEFFNLDVIIAVGYRVNSSMATRFRIWATQVLREYLLRGYAFNQRLNLLEDKIDRRFSKHDDRIAALEHKVDFFVQTQTPPLQGVFYEGQLWDACSLVEKPKHFLPRSFSEAPIRYSSLSSVMRKRSWNAVLVLTERPPYCALNFVMSLAASLLPRGEATTSTATPLRFFASISSVPGPTQLSIRSIVFLALPISFSTSEHASHNCPS